MPETAVKDLVLQVIYLRVYPFSIIPTYITEISFSLHNLQPLVNLVNCRGSDKFKLAASCRKLLPNINTKASVAFILLVPGQIHKDSLICWRACLEMLMRMTWTLSSWRLRKQKPNIARQHELRRPQYLKKNTEPFRRIKLLVSLCDSHQFP